MGGNVSNVTYIDYMFNNLAANGTFYYNVAYDYSKIIEQLPSGWTDVPCTLVDGGVLVPKS